MASSWAALQRKFITDTVLHNTGNKTGPSPAQEFGIGIISDVITRAAWDETAFEAATSKIVHWLTEAGPDAGDGWYEFHSLVISAAMSTSNEQTHRRLVNLIFALAQRGAASTANAENNYQDVSSSAFSILAELRGFGFTIRDFWNGPRTLASYRTNPNEAQASWVNLNSFAAHLTVQQRRTPVEPLQDWLEDFGLWTIADGLETPNRELVAQHAEPAASWLAIACSDIYADPTWGGRDGKCKFPDGPCRDGELWKVKLAAGAERNTRWDYWKERLREIAKNDETSQRIRNAAKDAEQAMARVDTL